jgi:hypothetical protein
MSRRRRFRLFLLALLLVVLAVLAVVWLAWYDWIREVLVVRAAYHLWLIGLAIRSRPQGLYWSLPIVAGAGAMILLLARQLAVPGRVRPPSLAVGRVADWAQWLDLAAAAPYFEKYLRRRVARLAERALQLEQGPHGERGDQWAPVVMPALPPEVKALLHPRHPPPPGTTNDAQARAYEVIVDYLESALEVDHDR